MPYQDPARTVLLTAPDGSVTQHQSLNAVLHRYGPRFVRSLSGYFNGHPRRFEGTTVATDRHGVPLDLDDVFERILGRPIARRAYRHDPVPGTGGRGHYRCLRRIRTTQEIKANAQARLEGEPPVRGHRLNLPTRWDDPMRHVEHNWKRQRRTQYRDRG